MVADFGEEWSRFDQSALNPDELYEMFNNYFDIFPWDAITTDAVGFDLDCGSGRWAKVVAPRVGKLHLIDPSNAIDVARRNLEGNSNCVFYRAGIGMIPLPEESCDFGYSLGVLHHVPDTPKGLRECVKRLKLGSPFLLYLYCRFDNKPGWFRLIWKITDLFRRLISRLPNWAKYPINEIIAVTVYLPLARSAWIIEKVGFYVSNLPLSQYRAPSYYTMRTDALDRFGTRLEKRFTKQEIEEMMLNAGLEKIKFSTRSFWTAVGFRKS